MIKEFLRKKLIKAQHDILAEEHELKYMFFELTDKCNIACVHCGSDCGKVGVNKDLPMEKILEVCRDIKTKYDSHKITVILSGGEPLCYPGIFELGKELIKLEFPWGMVTNGFGWDEAALQKAKEARLHTITVSLDGLKDSHNWLRGEKNSYDKAVNLIKMLVKDKFWKAMDVVTCVHQKNIGELDEVHKNLEELGVKNWRIFTIDPIGRAVQTPELFLNKEQFRHVMDKIVEYKKRGKIAVSYSDSEFLGCYEKEVRDYEYFCRAGINVSGIMVNGDILACPNIDRRFAQGNVFKDRFIDVWENKYKEFRDRNWMKTGQCEKCSKWNLCQGNSFHLWDLDKNETKICHYKKYDLEGKK